MWACFIDGESVYESELDTESYFLLQNDFIGFLFGWFDSVSGHQQYFMFLFQC